MFADLLDDESIVASCSETGETCLNNETKEITIAKDKIKADAEADDAASDVDASSAGDSVVDPAADDSNNGRRLLND